MVAASVTSADPVSAGVEAPTASEQEAAEVGPAARVGAAVTTVRPFDQFGRHRETATNPAAAGILNGTTSVQSPTPLATNGNGRPQAKRGRFTRAAANGGNGWSPNANGHAANGHGRARENGAEEDVAILERLSVPTQDWSSQDEEAQESALADAGRRRT